MAKKKRKSKTQADSIIGGYRPREINNRGDLGESSRQNETMWINGMPFSALDTRERTIQAQMRAGRKTQDIYVPLNRGTNTMYLPTPKIIPSIDVSTASVYRDEAVSKKGKEKSLEYSVDELMNLLRPYTIPSVYHNSSERYDAPRCYEGTRINVLNEIMNWVDRDNKDQSETTTTPSPTATGQHAQDTQFLWMHGPAGCGKSSIAQTVAEMCEKKGRLASDFFFPSSRSAQATVTVVMNENHDIHKCLVPTLASQLMVTVPAIGPYISREIRRDAHIFSRSLHIQLTSLIIKPFTQLDHELESRTSARGKKTHRDTSLTSRFASTSKAISQAKRDPYLIIIDALDECGQPESQKYILASLSSAVQQLPTARVSFLISSRPEQAIREAFNPDGGALGKYTYHLLLDEKYNPDEDIRCFIQSRFKEIVKEHPLGRMLGEDWPPHEAIEFLVDRASGQFAYASTVMRFIGSTRGRPAEHLEAILKFSTQGGITETHAGPFAELDDLYTSILMSIDEQMRQKVLEVLAFLSLTSHMDFEAHYYPNTIHPKWGHVCRTPAVVEAFLGYKSYDLLLAFADLHSLVEVPLHSAWASAQIRLSHPFLLEFLHNRARAGDLFVDLGRYAARFARRCIDLLVDWLRSDDTLENFYGSRTYHLAYQIFLQLFKWEYPDEQLLRDLTRLPVRAFIERLFHGKITKGNFSFLPLLFKWLKKEDPGLHNEYNSHYEAHMKSRLLSHSRPRWKYIFTAVSLKSDTKTFRNVFHFLDRREEESAFRDHFFPLTNIRQNLDTSDYLARLSRILTRHEPLVERDMPLVDASSYVELGIEFFDCFTVERKWMEVNWETSVDWDGILTVFYAILEKIPTDASLIRYLTQKRDQQLLEKIRKRVPEGWESGLRKRIQTYTAFQDKNYLIDTTATAGRLANGGDAEASSARAGEHLKVSVPPNPNSGGSTSARPMQQNGDGPHKMGRSPTNAKRGSEAGSLNGTRTKEMAKRRPQDDGGRQRRRRPGLIQRILRTVKHLF